jgi:hypothetical protein
MTYEELLRHYESAERAAGALGLTRQGVFRWKRCGIPIEQQIAFEVESKGALRADLPKEVRDACPCDKSQASA